MLRLAALTIAFAGALLSTCALGQDSNGVSGFSFPKEAIGSLEFETTFGNSRIGTGSFVQMKDGACYILTVRHLLGPNVDFAKEVAPPDVPHVVKGIRFYSFAGTDRYFSVAGLVIKPTGTDRRDPLFDLAAYAVQNPPDQKLKLADAAPAPGETVWIVAQVRGGAPEGELAHRATVVTSTDQWLHALWANDQIDSYGASGAPVLNAAGQMVGVESGHGMQNGHKLAFIIPAAMILSAIKASAAP